MTRLSNPHWVGFNGTPITGRVPTGLVVYGAPMTAEQAAEVAHTYKLFCDANLLALGDYQVRDRVLRDGTRVRCVSVNGVDRVAVWTRPTGDGALITLYFGYPLDTSFAAFEEPARAISPKDPKLARLKKLDGVMSVFMSEFGNVNRTMVSPYALIDEEPIGRWLDSGRKFIKASAPDGSKRFAYLPTVAEQGIAFAGTFHHGVVTKDATSSQEIWIRDADDDDSAVKLNCPVTITPNNHLVRLPNIAEPVLPEGVVLAKPQGLLDYAVLFGAGRIYDPLTNYAMGARFIYQVPREPADGENLSIPTDKDVKFVIRYALDTSYHTSVPATSARLFTLRLYATRVAPHAPMEEQEIHREFILTKQPPDQPDAAHHYTAHVMFAPNGTKVCVVIYAWATSVSSSNIAAAAGRDDHRGHRIVVNAVEIELSGGSGDEFPACAEHDAGVDNVFSYEASALVLVGYLNVMSYGGTTTYTGNDIGGAALPSGQIRTYGTREHGAIQPNYAAPHVQLFQRCVLVAYDKESVLQVVHLKTHFTYDAVATVTYERPESYTFDGVRMNSGTANPPVVRIYDGPATDATYATYHRYTATVTQEISWNGDVRYESTEAPFEEVTYNADYTFALDYWQVAQTRVEVDTILNSSPLRAVVLPLVDAGSNSAVRVQVRGATAGATYPTLVVTPEGIHPDPPASIPSDGTYQPYWIARHPMTERLLTTKGETWC